MKITFTYNLPVGESLSTTERLDFVLARWAKSASDAGPFRGFSRSKCARLIESGFVRVDRQRVLRPSLVLRDGAHIEIDRPETTSAGGELIADDKIKFGIVFEDNEVVVIDKPPNLVVHPGAGQEQGTLVHGLLAHFGPTANVAFRQVGASARPGIVHRLDKDTTGLMVVAKTEHAYQALIAQFRSREISRQYVALTIAVPQAEAQMKTKSETEAGEISKRLVRSERDRTRFVTSANRGKEAKTSWQVRARFRKGALLELRLATGRTHQIRVHLASVGAAIVGDPSYGPPLTQIPSALRGMVSEFGRQALHAERLRFVHPMTGQLVEFYSELPADMRRLVEAFSRN